MTNIYMSIFLVYSNDEVKAAFTTKPKAEQYIAKARELKCDNAEYYCIHELIVQ